MKTLPDKGVTIRCVLTDQKVGGSSPSERAKIFMNELVSALMV